MARIEKDGPDSAKARAAGKLVVKDIRIQVILEELRQFPQARLEQMAIKVNLSVSRVRHLFKQQVGISLQQYRSLKQLERAHELADTTLLSIKEIAALVGANDIRHFFRQYKRVYGHTPSERRASLAERLGELTVFRRKVS